MNSAINKIICSAALFLLALTCRADWPVGKGRTSLIASYNYFYSSKYFDANGKLASFNPGDKFQSHFYGLTMVHGLGRRLDVVANLPFIAQDQVSNGIRKTNSGVGDISVGLAYHFPSAEFQKHLTIKAQVIIPTYENNKTPELGYASKGLQATVNYSFTPIKQSFAVIEGSYTRFIDYAEGPNQYRGAFTFGRSLNKYSLVTFNFAHQMSESANTVFNPNPQATRNFSSGLLTFAYGRKISRTVTPYLQGAYTLYGKNIGLGMSASIFLVMKLP